MLQLDLWRRRRRRSSSSSSTKNRSPSETSMAGSVPVEQRNNLLEFINDGIGDGFISIIRSSGSRRIVLGVLLISCMGHQSEEILDALNPSRSGFLNSRNSGIFFHLRGEIIRSCSIPKSHHELHSHVIVKKEHMEWKTEGKINEVFISREKKKGCEIGREEETGDEESKREKGKEEKEKR
ncbi:hypothetical protein IC582_015495 [Cucumis melo]